LWSRPGPAPKLEAGWNPACRRVRCGAAVAVARRRLRTEQLFDRALDAGGGAGIVEHVAAQAMAQRRRGDPHQVLVADGVVALQRGEGAGGADQRQLAAQAVGAELHAQLRGALKRGVRHLDLGQLFFCVRICRRILASLRFHLSMKAAGSRSNSSRSRTTCMRLLRSFRRADLHRQAEAVEQLRAQLAFLRVAAAHQHETRRVAHAEALALDHVLAAGGHVQQRVDQMVFQQVGLVDVQKAAVGAGQQAGLEALLAAGQRALQVQRADDAVFGGAQRQVHHRHAALADLEFAVGAFCARQDSHSAASEASGSQL
jgi:hypothetical protein